MDVSFGTVAHAFGSWEGGVNAPWSKAFALITKSSDQYGRSAIIVEVEKCF